MTNIKLVNHSSVLIQEGDSFVLTDPWYETPAFGSWLPTPPTSIHPAYLLALSKTVENFIILVSHGHDDHIDDKFMSLFPKDTKIVIPEYRSKGLFKRISNLGFTKIIQAPTDGVDSGIFNFKSYINTEISLDDAIVTIETPNSLVIHANDNWQPIRGTNFEKMKKTTDRYNPENILYMSQCNLADGWPNIYKGYSSADKKRIHFSRVRNIIDKSLKNANNLNCKYFLNYAGYASAFVKDKRYLRDIVSYVSNEYINSRKENNSITEVVDMIPGDTFNFKETINQFPGIKLIDDELKKSSYEYYELYNKYDNCDTYQSATNVSKKLMKNKIENFLQGFNDFVMQRVNITKFNQEIVGFKVAFVCEDIYSDIIIGGNEQFKNKVAKFHAPVNIMNEFLDGKINWENLYIGYAGEVEVTPANINIRAVVRWLAMYGYKFQREQK